MRILQTLWLFIVSLTSQNTDETKPQPARLEKKIEEKPRFKDKLKNININWHTVRAILIIRFKDKLKNININWHTVRAILIIIAIGLIFLLICLSIYKTGALDSTNYYYRLGRG